MVLLLVCVVAAAAAGAAAAVVWLRRRFVLVTISGASMRPTFQTGDRVLVRRTPLAAVHQGAVVVVEQPDIGLAPEGSARKRGAAGRSLNRHWMIKRAAAVPGTPLPGELAAALGETPGTLVPPGCMAVLGDNRNGSYDSRQFGYLNEAQVLGVAVRAVGRAAPQSPPPRPEHDVVPRAPAMGSGVEVVPTGLAGDYFRPRNSDHGGSP